jgi:XTP/dITP diphosphohydrolase
MNRLVLASGNAGKLRELQDLLKDVAVDVVPQSDWNVPDADETGLSFVENAILKARHAALLTGLPALADDSGLVVDALDGAPGIFSARYASLVTGKPGSDKDNIARLLREMAKADPSRSPTARFVCVLAFVRHAEDPLPVICQATWEGEITPMPAGSNGFGYDPVFWLPNEGCTSAELAPERKRLISHRAQALRELRLRWAETGL